MYNLQTVLKAKPFFDQKIRTIYNEYKQFMCCNMLPDFEIRYVDDKIDQSIGYNAQVKIYEKPIILNVNINSILESDFKLTLYHEFTHLYDYITVSEYFNDDEMKDFFIIYSEYHAVQIQTLYSCNIYENINSEINIKNADINKFLKLPNKYENIYREKLILYSKKMNGKNFYDLKVAYMYFVGTIGLFHCIFKRDYGKIKFLDPYNKQMEEIADLLYSIHYKDTPSYDILNRIKELNDETDKIYLSNSINITKE